MAHLPKKHSSVVSSAPTILRPWVQILSTPSTLFSICIVIVTRKRTKINKKRPGLAHFFLKKHKCKILIFEDLFPFSFESFYYENPLPSEWLLLKSQMLMEATDESIGLWSSSVEGDEQPDQPQSHTCMECCHGMCCIHPVMSCWAGWIFHPSTSSGCSKQAALCMQARKTRAQSFYLGIDDFGAAYFLGLS